MPRVARRTRKRAEVKRAMRCSASPCAVAQKRLDEADNANGGMSPREIQSASEIKVGDEYYTWARKMGRGGVVYYQHVECGYPKRSQLSSRKTVAIEDAIDDAHDTIQSWSPELDMDSVAYSDGYEDVKSALESVANVARDVGQEYQDGYDAMPEGLNQGATAEAMQEVAQELESWADSLESWESMNDEPDLPEREDDETDDDYRERAQDALETWADGIRSEAEDALSDMPEYQG